MSSQGLTVANSIAANDRTAGSMQHGGAGTLASLMNQTGTHLGTLDSSLGTNQGNLQSGLGTALGNIETNRASQSVNNIWNGVNAVNGNTMGAAAQDRTDSSNNGILSKLLMGGI